MTDTNPALVTTYDRAAAEELARSTRDGFCGRCGKPMTVVYNKFGFWPATGQPKGSWHWVCGGQANARRRVFDSDHDHAILGYADPNAVAGEPSWESRASLSDL